jgi:hypothetical protein
MEQIEALKIELEEKQVTNRADWRPKKRVLMKNRSPIEPIGGRIFELVGK